MAQTDDVDFSVLGSAALAMKCFQREVEKHAEKSGKGSPGDLGQLVSFPAYSIMLFMVEYDSAGLNQKKHQSLLKKFGVDTAGNLKTFPLLSQSALFEIFGGLGLSRESIRRLLILLSDYGLLDRTSKGPPFPDQLGISKDGGRLMRRVAKRRAKDMDKAKQFGYL